MKQAPTIDLTNSVTDTDERVLDSLIRRATAELVGDLRRSMPSLAPAVTDWMRSLSPTERPEDRFLGTLMFPFLRLPWYLERAIFGAPDQAFHADLVSSSLSGYYFIRLVDNLVDGHADLEYRILPALSFFQLRFQQPYTRYFSNDHIFWDRYFSRFFLQANDRMQAELDQAPKTREAFRELAVEKYSMAKIPLAAVCHHRGHLDTLEAWSEVSDLMACFAQMFDDWIDWRSDHEKKPTLFLARKEEKAAQDKSLLAWFLADGFAWGIHETGYWLSSAKAASKKLGSQQLDLYFQRLEEALRELADPLNAGVASLRYLAARDTVPSGVQI